MNYWWGTDYKSSWERYVLEYILKKEKKDITVFDVWANIWWYCKMCIDVFWNKLQKIYCFEPSKDTFNQIKKNVIENKNIIINNLWLWEREQILVLYSIKNDSWWASLYNRDLSHINLNSNLSEKVSITTLDDYTKENNINTITLLKLDIEWYELLALKWWIDIITSWKVKYIQFEFWWTWIDARIYFKDFWNFLSLQYNIYRILPNNLYHIKKYEETLEIFTCVNFLCVLK